MKQRIVPLVALVMALVCALCLCGCATGPYQPQKKEQAVSDASLITPGTLTVGVNTSTAPYAVENQGEIVGINVDIAAALADAMGLKLRVIDAGINAENALTGKEVDIVLGVEGDKANFWTSSPYMQGAVVLFSLDQAAKIPGKKGSYRIAAQSASMSDLQATQHFGTKHIVECANPQEAFDLLNTSQVDYVASDSAIGSYAANSMGIQAYPVALLGDVASYRIEIPSTGTELQSAVATALENVKQGGTLNVIMAKWLGEEVDLEKLPKTSTTQSLQSPSNVSNNTSATTGE